MKKIKVAFDSFCIAYEYLFLIYGVWASFIITELFVTILAYLTYANRLKENKQLTIYTEG